VLELTISEKAFSGSKIFVNFLSTPVVLVVHILTLVALACSQNGPAKSALLVVYILPFLDDTSVPTGVNDSLANTIDLVVFIDLAKERELR
jgi:hypothetical protein